MGDTRPLGQHIVCPVAGTLVGADRHHKLFHGQNALLAGLHNSKLYRIIIAINKMKGVRDMIIEFPDLELRKRVKVRFEYLKRERPEMEEEIDFFVSCLGEDILNVGISEEDIKAASERE